MAVINERRRKRPRALPLVRLAPVAITAPIIDPTPRVNTSEGPSMLASWTFWYLRKFGKLPTNGSN